MEKSLLRLCRILQKRAKDYVKLVVFSVVDKTIPESELEICRKIAEDCGVKFRLREYIE